MGLTRERALYKKTEKKPKLNIEEEQKGETSALALIVSSLLDLSQHLRLNCIIREKSL